MKDEELRDNVQDALEFEPSIDATDIGVAVEAGVVTLTGHVATYAQKIAAERTVQAVKGVRGIAQEIEVRDSASQPLADDQIAARALSSIAWDAVIPGDRIQVKVQRGWVTLTGKVAWNFQREAAERVVRKLTGVLGVANLIEVTPAVQATNVRRRIEDALKRSAEIEAQHISVAVKDSKVTLEGKVHSWLERDAVKRAAWSAPGVASVEDRLTLG